MSDAQLTPLQQWLIEVAAEAKQRPWWRPLEGFDHIDRTCIFCGSVRLEWGQVFGDEHTNRGCPFAALDAALDKEPT